MSTDVDPRSPAVHRHIACCVEDTPGSMAALAEALAIHSAGDGRLSVVHVVDVAEGAAIAAGEGVFLTPPEGDDAAVAWLDALVKDLPRV